MSDESATAVAPAVATPKKKAKTAAKKPKTAPTHPKVSEMVTEAITNLKERGGSSLQAIKKHVGSKHKVDMDRLTPFIKKYLKSAVASGALVQTKGKGASGSFKLGASGQKKEPSKAKKSKKEGASPAKKAKTAAKKTAKPKAKSAEKKKPAAKKPAAKKAAKAKSPKKAAKPSKPKAPKVKKMKTPKKATPKKAKK